VVGEIKIGMKTKKRAKGDGKREGYRYVGDKNTLINGPLEKIHTFTDYVDFLDDYGGNEYAYNQNGNVSFTADDFTSQINLKNSLDNIQSFEQNLSLAPTPIKLTGGIMKLSPDPKIAKIGEGIFMLGDYMGDVADIIDLSVTATEIYLYKDDWVYRSEILVTKVILIKGGNFNGKFC
jgi:hypothetical protein